MIYESMAYGLTQSTYVKQSTKQSEFAPENPPFLADLEVFPAHVMAGSMCSFGEW
jgi:hypothetical protein